MTDQPVSPPSIYDDSYEAFVARKEAAFDRALDAGVLSRSGFSRNYVGDFYWKGTTFTDRDAFEHKRTGRCVYGPEPHE